MERRQVRRQTSEALSGGPSPAWMRGWPNVSAALWGFLIWPAGLLVVASATSLSIPTDAQGQIDPLVGLLVGPGTLFGPIALIYWIAHIVDVRRGRAASALAHQWYLDEQARYGKSQRG